MSLHLAAGYRFGVDAKGPGWIIAEKIAEARARGGGKCLKRALGTGPPVSDAMQVTGPAERVAGATGGTRDAGGAPADRVIEASCRKMRCMGIGVRGLTPTGDGESPGGAKGAGAGAWAMAREGGSVGGWSQVAGDDRMSTD